MLLGMSESKRPCLTCEHCVRIPPPDWKPSYEGGSYDRWNLGARVRDGRPLGTLMCSLNPVWVSVRYDHHCGQWESGIGQQAETAREFIHGSWEMREAGHLRAEVKQLKAALKTARKRSTSRLARLQERRGQTPRASG